jgi:HEPN domain-containing protein
VHLEFFLDFQAAREMYVTARVCLQNGLVRAGLHEAHQSIEILTKAIMHLEPEHYYCARKDDPSKTSMISFWGHSLGDLIGKATVHNTKLNDIMRDTELRAFLKALTDSYDAVRYGEAGFSAPVDAMIQCLDRVVLGLDNAYLEKIKGQRKTKLLVPKPFHVSFLRDNSAYSANDTSESPLANNPAGNPPETVPDEK